MKEREIDTTDIPPTADWSKAVVGSHDSARRRRPPLV